MEKDGYYRNMFRASLWPYFEMMDYKRSTMRPGMWIQFVESVRLSIINNPEQFLGKDIPSKEIISKEMTVIFKEYLTEIDAVVLE